MANRAVICAPSLTWLTKYLPSLRFRRAPRSRARRTMPRSMKPSWRLRAAAGFSVNTPSAIAMPIPAWSSTRWSASRKASPRKNRPPPRPILPRRWPRSATRSPRRRHQPMPGWTGFRSTSALPRSPRACVSFARSRGVGAKSAPMGGSATSWILRPRPSRTARARFPSAMPARRSIRPLPRSMRRSMNTRATRRRLRRHGTRPKMRLMPRSCPSLGRRRMLRSRRWQPLPSSKPWRKRPLRKLWKRR